MKGRIVTIRRSTLTTFVFGFTVVCGVVSSVYAEPISPSVQAKVDTYKKKLETWAANPVLVAAVKDANAKGAIPGMNNGKWDGLDENDPVVKGMQSNAAGKLLVEWDKADPGMSKLYLRDEKANLLAGSNKALRYNNFTAPQFASCIKGGSWADKDAKPDPSTGEKSVQICAAVLDGGKPIGVLNSAVSAK